MKTLFFATMIIASLSLSLSCSSKNEKFSAKSGKALVSKEVNYELDGKTMKGYLVLPEGEGPFPGVLVVHEWWGQTDYPRERARQFAENGYAAFAVDMYGDGKTADHPKDAKSFAGQVMGDMDLAEKSFRKAMEVFQNEPQVDGKQLAAAGYCFGGAVVLEMARRGLPLQLVASYHGDLSPLVENSVRPSKTRFLIFNGAADPMVKPEAVETARRKLKNAKIRYKLISFKDAKHGFTNPEATKKGQEFELPLEYNERADQQSWAQTMDALKIVFKKADEPKTEI